MQTIKIGGIDIEFPFKPYPIQIAYMGQIIRAAKNKKNALLESPTGTGKTLSILCSALAWLNSEINKIESKRKIDLIDKIKDDGDYFGELKNKLDNLNNKNSNQNDLNDVEEEGVLRMPKIYFSSRTHSQLSQSIKELKKTEFLNENSAVVLAGRDLLCINEDVQKLDNIGAKNQACKSKIGANCSCKYYNDVERKVRDTKDYKNNPILDVEDLIKFGHKHSVCPYFASKSLKKRSQVIFLPYNYLLDPKIRKAQKITFNDDVIIFDEGHNIEKTCEESVSVDLRSDHLACCIREMRNIYRFYQESMENQLCLDSELLDAVQEFTAEDLVLLKQILDDLEKSIDEKVESLFAQRKVTGDSCEMEWIFEVFKKCNLNLDNNGRIIQICDKIQAFLTCLLPVKGPIATVASSSLNSFKDFLSLLFPDDSTDIQQFQKDVKEKYKIYIEILSEEEVQKTKTPAKQSKQVKRNQISNWLDADSESTSKSDDNVKKWILHIWCLSPSVGLKGLLKNNVRSVVLTSGTLAPLDSFEAEFNTKFECKIQNQHIIESRQMAIYPVSYSFNNTRLDSTFGNKDNISYYKALGDTIIDICQRVPDGVLLFFSSYSVMNNSIKKWKDNDREWKTWTKLNNTKQIFMEGKNRDEFTDEINRFKECVERGRGGIFFGICRGKLSEGIDLGGIYSRSVVLIGLPYPAVNDPRVKLKRLYLDAVKHPNFTSGIWYQLQMKRALNQAIGRAIRHKDDYGCVFLLDYRFENQIRDLSKWCQNFVRRNNLGYDDMMLDVKNFFKNNKLANLNRPSKQPTIKSDVIVEDKNQKYDIKSVLDFSLSEYTNLKSKSRSSKKRSSKFTSSLDDSKKSKKITTDKVSNVFDLFTMNHVISEDEEESNLENAPKKVKSSSKGRKHISIEYMNSDPSIPSTSNQTSQSNQMPNSSLNIVADNKNILDSIILLDD